MITLAIGALFIGLALTVLMVSDRTAGPLLGALALGGLGIDAVASVIQRRPSLLERIGPLP
ncbi:hypothetical protein [Synechococcus sp. CCY 9618]|uniref:hypothetical protein n=1 Tax=Synechococcus sp. CCY 9618 TaxID=2815602 RepID=UPI001C23E2FD|nr:hypothetical protein [Synechococcus sp. CCY 9618]